MRPSVLKEPTRSVGDVRFGDARTASLKGIAEPQELTRVEWR